MREKGKETRRQNHGAGTAGKEQKERRGTARGKLELPPTKDDYIQELELRLQDTENRLQVAQERLKAFDGDSISLDLPTANTLFDRYSSDVEHQIRKVQEADNLYEHERFKLAASIVRAYDESVDMLKKWLREEHGEEVRFREDPKTPQWRSRTKKIRDMDKRTKFNERFKVVQKLVKRYGFERSRELREEYGIDNYVDAKGVEREWAFMPPNTKVNDLAAQWGTSTSIVYKFLSECSKHGHLKVVKQGMKGRRIYAAGYYAPSGTDMYGNPRHRIVWFLKEKSHSKTLPEFRIRQ